MYNKAQFLISLSLRYLWFDIEIRTQAGNERMCTCPEVLCYLSMNLLLKVSTWWSSRNTASCRNNLVATWEICSHFYLLC